MSRRSVQVWQGGALGRCYLFTPGVVSGYEGLQATSPISKETITSTLALNGIEPCLTLPYILLSYLNLSYFNLPYLTLLYLTLPYVLLYLTLPYLTLAFLTLP